MSECFECRKHGCSQTFESKMGRGNHEGNAHDLEIHNKAEFECPNCEKQFVRKKCRVNGEEVYCNGDIQNNSSKNLVTLCHDYNIKIEFMKVRPQFEVQEV